MIIFVLSILETIWFILSVCGWGYILWKILSKFIKPPKISTIELFLITFTLGWLLWAQLCFLLLCTQLFYSSILKVILTIGFIAQLYWIFFDNFLAHFSSELKKRIHSLFAFNTPSHTYLSILMIINLLIYLLLCFTPVTAMDALNYHLDTLKQFILHHGFSKPYSLFDYFPYNIELLFLPGQIFKIDYIGNLINLFLLIITVLQGNQVIQYLYKKRTIWSEQIWPALLIISAMTCFIVSGLFIEFGIAFLLLSAFYWLLRAFDTKNQIFNLILAGISLGILIGSKSNMPGYVVIIFIMLLFFWKEIPLRNTLVLAVTSLLLGCNWYLHNFLASGCLFFPPQLFNFIQKAAKNYGIGYSLLDFILLPFTTILYSSKFDSGYYLNPAFFIAIPLFFIAAKEKRSRFIWLCGVSILFLIFLTSQQARFFFIPLILINLLLPIITEKINPLILRVLFMIYIATFSIYTATNLYFLNVHLPFLLGRETKTVFLSKYAWHYSEFEWLNHNIPNTSLVFVEPRSTYYLQIPYLKSTGLEDQAIILKDTRFQYYLLTSQPKHLPGNIVLYKVFDTKLVKRKVFGQYSDTNTYLYKRIGL